MGKGHDKFLAEKNVMLNLTYNYRNVGKQK